MRKVLPKPRAPLCAFLWLTSLATTAQVTTTFNSGPDWRDGTIIEGYTTDWMQPVMQVDQSYPNYTQLAATSSNTSPDEKKRSLIRINLAHLIPAGTVIQSATLELANYGYSVPGGPNDTENTGANATYLQRVTQSWTSPTWNTQPTTTTTGQISIPAYTGSNGTKVQVDVTAMIQDMINNPASNFGFMLKLQTESSNRARNLRAATLESRQALQS